MSRAPRRRHTGDEGSAVVEFALVSVLLVMLLLAVLQAGVYLHVRNVVAASAAEGARYAANADVPAQAGAGRARDLIARTLGAPVESAVRCSAGENPGASGTMLVAVRCRGGLPVFFAPVGKLLPLDVTGHSIEERR